MGSDIDGESRYDQSGWSVSLSSDGSTVAIGAIENDGNAPDSGHVRVYNTDTDGDGTADNADAFPLDSSESVDTDDDGTGNNADTDDDGDGVLDTADAFPLDSSESVDTDGDGTGNNADTDDDGDGVLDTVDAFPLDSTNIDWFQLGSDIDGESGANESGTSVSLSSDGTTVAIGAPWNDKVSGHVRIFSFDSESATWIQLGSDIDGESGGDRSGYSVSLSSDGTTVAIGAYRNGGNGTDAGHVRIFSFDSESATWIQLGSDIDGENEGDNSGYSVSLSSDGTTVAIGAYRNGGNGTDAGHVRIYSFDSESASWIQLGSDIVGESAGDWSGFSVSLSSDGSTVAIGAIYTNRNRSNSGHVRVYNFDSGSSSWVQLGSDIDGEFSGDRSGSSVSLSSDGSTVAIGARLNYGNGPDSGHVRVYNFDSGSASWVQSGADIDGEFSGDQSGFSVSLSSDGSTVAIGALYNDGNGSNSGHVRVYNFDSGTSTWTQVGSDIDGESENDWSGTSVSLSSDGSTVAIGAPSNYGNGESSGHVRIYSFTDDSDGDGVLDTADAFPLDSSESVDTDDDGTGDNADTDDDNDGVADTADAFPLDSTESVDTDGDGTGNNADTDDDGDGVLDTADAFPLDPTKSQLDFDWVQLGSDIDGESEHNGSGQSVSLSSDGSTVAIGAYRNDENGSNSGHVRVYNFDSESSIWVQIGSDIDGESLGDDSGISVSLSSDGSTVAIGAPGNDGNGQDSGQVQIYNFDSESSTWVQMGPDIDGEFLGDESGATVSLSSDGSTVAIGAPGNDGNGTVSGHVRVYNFDSGSSTWTQVGFDIDGESAGDRSGHSVSLSSDGTTVAIGAPENSENGNISGHVRVYNFDSGSSTWIQMGSDIDGESSGDRSAGSVLLDNTNWVLGDRSGSVSLSSDGTTVAIGASGNDDNGSNSGHVRVYSFDSGSSIWTQVGSDIDGEFPGYRSGDSVSLSSDGSTVAIGAPYYDGNRSALRSGPARIYNYDSESSTWIQMGSYIDGGSVGARSGSVSLSSDGSTVAIGAYGNGSNSGHVRIFSFTDDSDGDGVPDIEDAFPLDSSESADSDDDGTGDNADAFPLDSSESVDTDDDGTGDNADAFPLDPSENADTDNDGIGNNADTDDDGDGVLDTADAFPLDPTKSQSSGVIVNVSARVTLGLNEMVTPGFVVNDAPTKLLIRAVGPRLGDFGVDYLPNPRMTIFDSSQNLVRAIDDWTYDNPVSELSDLVTATASAGAFPLAQDTASAATLVTLDPGAYTVQVDSADEGVGDVLVEVYEISSEGNNGVIVNVSARVTLGLNEMVTPGFVVNDAPTKLLIRAVGPRLGDFGVDYLPNPRMTIFDSSQNLVRAIDDWTYDNPVSELSDLVTATASAGAFPLAQDTASAATLVTLDPGAYTVQVDSADEGVGDVLVEVYEISE
jgi:hypothetical protein